MDYFRLKSRKDWLRKHRYVKIDTPTAKDIRTLGSDIRLLQRRIGELKSEDCPAHIIENIDFLSERKCAIHQVAYNSFSLSNFFEQYCYACPFSPEDVVAIMAANAFRKDKHQEGD